jgi:septum formation protein
MISFSKKSCQNKVMSTNRRLVLASTSRYRAELLARFGLPFERADPGVDEAPLAGEGPAQTALRLATLKAGAVRAAWPDALIIGSDQVASLDGKRLGKPGTHEKATRQLASASGRTVQFDTAVALLDATTGRTMSRLVPCQVTFRALDAGTIETYLLREKPYDCAGSAKAEGLGIALIERIQTDDPTSLVGLPLMALTELLALAGMPVLAG